MIFEGEPSQVNNCETFPDGFCCIGEFCLLGENQGYLLVLPQEIRSSADGKVDIVWSDVHAFGSYLCVSGL